MDDLFNDIIKEVKEKKDYYINKKNLISEKKELIDINTDISFDNNDLQEMIKNFSLIKTEKKKENPPFTKSYRDIFMENDINKLKNEIFKLKDLILSNYDNNFNKKITILDKLDKNEFLINEKENLQYLFINNINVTPIVDDIQNYYLSKPIEENKYDKSFNFYNNYFEFQRDDTNNKYSWESKINDIPSNFFTKINKGNINKFNNESDIFNIVNQWYKQFKFESKNTLKKNEVIKATKGLPYKLYKKILNEGTSFKCNENDFNWMISSTDNNKVSDLIMFDKKELVVPKLVSEPEWINKCCGSIGRCNTIKKKWNDVDVDKYEFPSLLRIYSINNKNDRNIINFDIKTKLIRKNINLPYNPEQLDNNNSFNITYHKKEDGKENKNINIIERFSYKSTYILEDDLDDKKIKKSCNSNKYPELIDFKEKNIPISKKLINGESVNMTGIFMSQPKYNVSNGIEIILDNNENINKYYPKINNDGINICNIIDYSHNTINFENNNNLYIMDITNHNNFNFYEKYDKESNYFLKFNKKDSIKRNINKILPSIDDILEIEYSKIEKCNNFTDLSKILSKYQFSIYDLTDKQIINLKKKIENNSKNNFYEIKFYDKLNMKIFEIIDYQPSTDVFILNEDINESNFIDYLKFYSLFLCCNKLKLAKKNDILSISNLNVNSEFSLNCINMNHKKYLKLGSLLIPLYEHSDNIDEPFDIENTSLKDLIETKINQKLSSNEMFKKMCKLKNKVKYEDIYLIYELHKLKKYNYYNIDSFNILYKTHLMNLLKCSFDNGDLFFKYLKHLNINNKQKNLNRLPKKKDIIDQIRELKNNFLTKYEKYDKTDNIVKIYYNYQSLKNDNNADVVYYNNEFDETSNVSKLLNNDKIKEIFFPDEPEEYDDNQKKKLLKLYYPFNTKKDIVKKLENFNNNNSKAIIEDGDYCLLIEDGVKDFYKRVKNVWIKYPSQKCNNLKNLNLRKILESKNYDQLFNCKNCIKNCNICQGKKENHNIWEFIKEYNIRVNQLSIIIENEKLSKKIENLDQQIDARINFNNEKNIKKNKKYIKNNGDDDIDKNILKEVLEITGFENRISYEKNLITDLKKELTSKKPNSNKIKEIIKKYQLEMGDKNYYYYKYDNKKMQVLCSHFTMNVDSLKEIKHKIDNETKCILCGFVFNKELYDNTDFFPHSYGEINDNLSDDVLQFNSLVGKLIKSIPTVDTFAYPNDKLRKEASGKSLSTFIFEKNKKLINYKNKNDDKNKIKKIEKEIKKLKSMLVFSKKIIKNLNKTLNSNNITYKFNMFKKWKQFNKNFKKKLLPEENKDIIDDQFDINNNDEKLIDAIIKNLFEEYNLSKEFTLKKNFNLGLKNRDEVDNKITETLKLDPKYLKPNIKWLDGLDDEEKIYNFMVKVKNGNKNIIELWDNEKRNNNIKKNLLKKLKETNKLNMNVDEKEIDNFITKYRIEKNNLSESIELIQIYDQEQKENLEFRNEYNFKDDQKSKYYIYKDYELKSTVKSNVKLSIDDLKDDDLKDDLKKKYKKDSFEILKINKLKIKYFLSIKPTNHDNPTYLQIVNQLKCRYNYNLWKNNNFDIQKNSNAGDIFHEIKSFYNDLHIKTMLYFFVNELNTEGNIELNADYIFKATQGKKKTSKKFANDKFISNLKECYKFMEKDKPIEIISDYNWLNHEPFFSNEEKQKLQNVKKDVQLKDIKNKDDNKNKIIFVTNNNHLNFNLSKKLKQNKHEINKDELKRKLKLINTIYYEKNGNYYKRYFKQIYDHDYDRLFEYLNLENNEEFPDNKDLIKKLLEEKKMEAEQKIKKEILDQMDEKLARIYTYDLDKLKKICINNYIKPKKEKDQIINQIINNNLHYVEIDINSSNKDKLNFKHDIKIDINDVDRDLLKEKLDNFESQTNKKINKVTNFSDNYDIDKNEWNYEDTDINIDLDDKYEGVKNIYKNNFKIENISEDETDLMLNQYIENQKNNERKWFKINFIKDIFMLISKSKFEKKGQINIINKINLELSKKYLDKNEIEYFKDLINNNNNIESRFDIDTIENIDKIIKLIQNIKDYDSIKNIILYFFKTNYRDSFKKEKFTLPWSDDVFDDLSKIENYSDTYIQFKIKEYNENENTLRRKRYEKKSDEERESHGLIRKLKLGNIINENEREEELFEDQNIHAGNYEGHLGVNNYDNPDHDNEDN